MKRHIRGLEDHEAQEKKRLYRDVRSPAQRLADALKTGQVQTGGIFAAGACLFLFPACATLLFCLGLALFLARCACVNNERLPFRMPLGLSGTDRGDPLPGRNGFAAPEGVFFLGNRLQDRQELWLKAKDILTHCLLFGTTGSGKTETLVSLSYNALATASGLFYIDPKASPKLAVQIWQMARFLGRDDDFRVLNYGTSGKVKGKSPRRLSNTNNPFTFGSAEALTQLLVSLMPASDGANSIFADKAQALISGVMYALVDLRDKGLLKLSTSIIRDSLALEKCVALALHPELDQESRASIHAALATVGWIAGREMKDQPESFAEQFGYAQSYFGKALSSLTDTYSHIYGAEDGEVDFSDAIMQRRILVVLLPSLEKAPAELASLGKISLSAIRNACAVGLGARIEGDAEDVLEALPTDAIGIGPYLCIVDEYAAIVTPGFEVVLTQGRGLGIAAIVASQDYAGILEADQKGAQQMVANTCLKIFMRMQDAEKTWELLRGQAGQSTVLRTTGFNINEQISSDYRDAMNTTVEQEDRVVLRDLQEQIEGEAHFVFSGQIVRGDMFYANPSLKKAQLRVPQLLQLIQENKSNDLAA
ncbi:type IV secretory system conjugative DNA transfer family protein [uncultured Desulfovibrio sp.]|uniref:type IV secretory system conjugative DNA transfer family protein n=1 Tax=uncultured Desulfovibrio sp. TaxID=167968 RepID=UPI00272C0F4E|nr:TraM recognition domain-containing protein [uncultured Desulfovibrio sp.]